MIGRAACRGAATIVNAIATGRGAAFGISLEADALVQLEPGRGDIVLQDSDEGRDLVTGCVQSVLRKTGGGHDLHGEVAVRSEIPASRGLKSSSAVSNAVILATSKALETDLSDLDLLLTGVEESIRTKVSITGAFDDAAACFFGGVVATDNRSCTILARGKMDPELQVILHVPDRKITKASIKSLDFSKIEHDVEKAFDLALRGEYLKAIEANSRAYCRVLDVSEDIAELARKKGALAAGISGTGPATAILCDNAHAADVLNALEKVDGIVLSAHVNDTPAKEVVPRLL